MKTLYSSFNTVTYYAWFVFFLFLEDSIICVSSREKHNISIIKLLEIFSTCSVCLQSKNMKQGTDGQLNKLEMVTVLVRTSIFNPHHRQPFYIHELS